MTTIKVYERECPADDYDTENGLGFPDDVEPVLVGTVELGQDDADGAVQVALDDVGCGEWDGGSVGYDPDGSRMAADAAGTITERYAVIDREPTCPDCGSDEMQEELAELTRRLGAADSMRERTELTQDIAVVRRALRRLADV